jgi:steroid delta-isomerase-like uncharacterized protein
MQDIKDAVMTAWEAAWDRGDVDALDAVLHPDYQRESAGSQHVLGADELKHDIRDIRSAFPDLATSIDTLIVDEDGASAAIFWHSTGTFTEELQGVPATGRRVETHGSNLLTLRDGRIVNERVTWDQTELLADLGLPSLRSAFEADAPDIVVDVPGAAPHLDALKGFNRQFVTGVTVVTTIDEQGQPRGLAANAYSSVSLEPPLVLICVQKTAGTYASLFRATHLGINIMSNRQREVVGTFASKVLDKFAGLPWHAGPGGSPLIDGSSASIEAEIKERFQAKTHTVFIAKVTHAEVAETDPMIYKAGRFFDSVELTEL